MQYVLPLTAADTGSTRRMTTLHVMLAFVLCGIGAGCLVLYWFTGISPKFPAAYRPFAVLGSTSFLAGLAIVTTSVFYKKWLMQGRRSLMLRLIEVLILAAAGTTFAIVGQYRPATIFGVICVAILAATLWELRKPPAQQVLIDEKGITLPKRGLTHTIRWREIEAVLLRHSILSVEIVGNQLVQRSIDQTAPIDASSIESFSKTLIQKYEKERAANADW
jgi:hypothetical protein